MPKTQPKFVHLHAHSHYSLLDGLGKVPDIIKRVKELGMDSIALTDHGVLYGAIEFFETATAAGLKPIVGCEVYVAPGSRLAKDGGTEAKPYHLILLAKDMTGYQNLLRLVTEAHLGGYYYKPRIDWELLEQHHQGLICSSACLQGEVAQAILKGDEAGAQEVAERYGHLFGKDHYYLELQHHPSIPEQGQVNQAVKRIAATTGLPLVATNDAHYVRPDDAEAQDALLCVQTGKQITDTDRMDMRGEDFSLKTPAEMAEAFKDTPEAIANTQKIADMVNLKIELGGMILPKFDVPDGQTAQQYLRKKVAAGIKERYGAGTSEIKERVKYEMGVIEKMGFESYFLIVADFVNWAKDHDIVVGPGRGSGAGSIAAYALKITNLDPIEFGLLFERFLNPDRISMPDFDLDFADDRRHEVIEYVADKYGADHVAQVITFGTLGAKAAVRDTGRVMGMGYTEVDAVAKLIPTKPGTKLADARRQTEMKDHEQANPQVTRLLDLAEKLEGSNRHASTHAAGVVIGDQPLVNYIPLQQATKGSTGVITQYSMWPIEKIGLLKMDFLGLSNLTILRNAQEIIEAVYDVKVDVDTLPLDDKKTFELLAKAQTHGVFQLESDGMRRYIRELKPNQFADIVAMVSLYRPGPMQFIDSFIRRKHGQEKVTYPHPKVEKALKETYGVIVYQEQVMQISKDLAGFSGGEADTLRKAVGKKIATLLKQMQPRFVEGAVENGASKQVAEKLFTDFEKFAEYCFNKSHAACYALIAYQTAYLKAHYPSAFMAALMTSEQENLDKLTMAITECEQLGIKVLPPDVGESFANFAVAPDKQSLRFGLSAIKNLGKNTVAAIITTRKEHGIFADLTDFLSRLPDGAANRKSLEALIKAGALDSLVPAGDGDPRGRLLAGLEGMCRYASARSAESRSGQTSLFGESETGRIGFALPATGSVDDRQKLDWERELLGMYISEHPLTAYRHVLTGLPALASLAAEPDGQAVTVGGLVGSVKSITTRRGDPMAFVTIEDRHSQLELIVFPKLYAEKRDLLTPGQILKITGKVSRKDGDVKLLADRFAPLTEASPGVSPVVAVAGHGEEVDEAPSGDSSAETASGSEPNLSHSSTAALAQSTRRESSDSSPSPGEALTIRLPGDTTLEAMEDVRRILADHHGQTPVYLIVPKGGTEVKLKLPIGVHRTPELAVKLEAITQSIEVGTAGD